MGRRDTEEAGRWPESTGGCVDEARGGKGEQDYGGKVRSSITSKN